MNIIYPTSTNKLQKLQSLSPTVNDNKETVESRKQTNITTMSQQQ
jgi:hypothetical protein